MTLEERKELANDLRKKGYNCSQCVAMAFEDIHNIPAETMAKIAIGLGGGVGGQGEVCGVISAMALVEGFKTDGAPTDKILAYQEVKRMADEFCKHNNSIICRKLKSATPPRPCNDLIIDGIEILHNHLNQGNE